MNCNDYHLTPDQMLNYSLALLLAVRCRQKDAALQLLHRFYHELSEKQARRLMNRTIYLLEPQERDWLKDLA